MTSRFVIHEHYATHLHYDFRLELEGVLRSWVIPKGPSMNPSDKRLALLVEDHPLEYIDFEGIIPKGHYGAGAVVIWDRGSYELNQLKKEKINFFLKGRKLKGAFTLMLLKGRGKGNEWILIKKNDQYALPNWELETSLTPEKQCQLREQTPM
ncbi:MAG: 3'-phosphoesterase [Deltaproteobacteria bacterium]|nr:MAG: 3'-phosphoesterase [Deltaproteobacteria bacterium]